MRIKLIHTHTRSGVLVTCDSEWALVIVSCNYTGDGKQRTNGLARCLSSCRTREVIQHAGADRKVRLFRRPARCQATSLLMSDLRTTTRWVLRILCYCYASSRCGFANTVLSQATQAGLLVAGLFIDPSCICVVAVGWTSASAASRAGRWTR